MESRRQQRSFALNHIPPFPISHGLEYALGSRMYVVVVNVRGWYGYNQVQLMSGALPKTSFDSPI